MRRKPNTFLIAGLVGLIGLACYPIIIEPMLNTEKYRNVQRVNRSGVVQEDIQPGNMKVWSNPFEPKKQ